jgi:peptide/nickel transport system substrate-binding protein
MARRRLLPVLAVLVLAPAAAFAAPKRAPHANEVRSDKAWVEDPASDPAKAKAGGSVVLTLLADPDSLNPYLSTYADVEDVMKMTFPQLMHEQPDYAKGPPDFTPYAAERWETSADGQTLTFFLRKDMTWSDGMPVSADDVKFSWETAKNADVAWTGGSIKDFIDDVKVVDPKTVALHYTAVYPYQLMDANDGFIVPKHVFGKIPYKDWRTKASWTAEAGVTAGPYRVTEYTAQERVVLEANPKYYRAGFPRIGKITFRIIKNLGAQRDALLSGGVDAVQSVQPLEVKRILDDGRFRVFNCLSRGFTYVGWNCRKFPTDDPDVRRAFTLAIDRDDLVEALYVGYADVATSPILSSFWAHDETMKPLPFDPDEATKLLESKGWKKGDDGVYAKEGKRLALTILTSSANELRVKACTKVQAYLKEIGAEMKIELVEPNQLAERLRKHDFQAEYGAWYVATKVDEKPTWHSASRDYDGFNWVDYVNPRVDEIIDKARVMGDFKAAKPLWVEMQRIVEKEQPYTFVAEPRLLNAYHKKIRGILSASVGPYLNVEEWWIDEGGK